MLSHLHVRLMTIIGKILNIKKKYSWSSQIILVKIFQTNRYIKTAIHVTPISVTLRTAHGK